MIQWQLPPQLNIPPNLLEFTSDPLLAQLLTQRGLTDVEQAIAFLDPNFYQPASPLELPDMEAAVSRLSRAIERQELVYVWGDFDVDGQTSTALLVSMLRELGGRVGYYIPNRLTESHGIRILALERVLADNNNEIKLILTCDTGVSEHEAVVAAYKAGVEVIITDHHDLPDSLPQAEAVINPKRLPISHPLRELPGVGVAYKLAQALYSARGAGSCETLLDLVALGIVADVAVQKGDTRYLLQKGLDVLRKTSRLGLQALCENANINIESLTEQHIGFWLAPRLNALGRLSDANLAVELLTTTDNTRARIIAMQLEGYNDRRKMLVDKVTTQALGQLEDTPSLVEGYNAIVLVATDWHAGVIGIAANRLVEQYNKPVVLISRSGGQGHGSARSVSGCDIHRAFKTQAHLLSRFGGHPMAAGMTIQVDDIPAFRRGLSKALADEISKVERKINIDIMVDLPQISKRLLDTIQKLAPFGMGNPPINLGCTALQIADEQVFGKTGLHKRLVVQDEAGQQQALIWWRGVAEDSPPGRFDLAFNIAYDEFRGGDNIQLTWLEAREQTSTITAPDVQFIDWRQVISPEQEISKLAAYIIWAEGIALPSSLPRHKLNHSPNLIIWSTPPDQNIFQQVVGAVQPEQIFIVGQPSPLDSFTAFIKRLMSLIKYAVTHQGGEIKPEILAASLGHKVSTARLGIDWLAAQGKLDIEEAGELLILRFAQKPVTTEAQTVDNILKSALAETEAYRHFFKQASLSVLKKMVY